MSCDVVEHPPGMLHCMHPRCPMRPTRQFLVKVGGEERDGGRKEGKKEGRRGGEEWDGGRNEKWRKEEGWKKEGGRNEKWRREEGGGVEERGREE